MRCKRSFFSSALFKKNLTRFWPVWGLSSLGGALIPLWMLLNLVGRAGDLSSHMARDFADMLYVVAAEAVPILTIPYAVLCAMLVWGYLMNARSVGLMHTLPVDRTCLFVTGTASGLAMMLIPYAVTGGFTCLIALCWGFMDFRAVSLTVLAVLLLTVTYFGIATFCAMVTGNSFAVPALYGLLNFLAPMVTALFNDLYTNFFLGLTHTQYTISSWLCPPIKIAQNFQTEREFLGTHSYENRFTVLRGWGTLALYALAGLALLAVSWLLYRLRHSEHAGDVMVFSWLRPVFRYGTAALSALTVGRIFYALFWQEIFQKGRWYDVLPMAVCLAAGGVLGYYIASMLLEKSLRVFRGSLKGVGVVCAGVLVLSLWLAFDPFGLVTHVPDAEDVERVQVSYYTMHLDLRSGEDQAFIEDVVALHQAVVDDRAYVLAQDRNAYYTSPYDSDREKGLYSYLDLVYTLKNGSTLARRYPLGVTRARAEDPATFDGMLAALVESERAVREDTVAFPYGCGLEVMRLYNGLAHTEYGILDHWDEILAALERDLEAGHIPRLSLFEKQPPQTESYQVSLEMEFGALDGNNDHYAWREVEIYPAMTETIQCLLDLNYLSEEELAELQEDYYALRSVPEDQG